jgi:hypothetical protein
MVTGDARIKDLSEEEVMEAGKAAFEEMGKRE